MSDGIINQTLNKEADEQSIKVREMEVAIHKKKVVDQFKKIKENEELEQETQCVDLSLGNSQRLKRIKGENSSFWESLKDVTTFINDDFKKVAFFPGTVTLVLGLTGQGKSTASANITYHCLTQGKKVLVLTNEEKANDCYNRVTCLAKKWHYQDHQSFTEDQQRVFNSNIDFLGSRMTVIDDTDQETGTRSVGQTTSVEGMANIFKKIVEAKNNGNKYDVIIIDYYQNVFQSLRNDKNEPWQNQEKFAKMLDQLKDLCGAPIVLLGQKKPGKEDAVGDWKSLIEGRKSIANVVTTCLEMVRDADNFRTEWKFHKSRWASIGHEESVFTGYDRGKFVRYTDDFKRKVIERQDRIAEAQLLEHRRRQLEEK